MTPTAPGREDDSAAPTARGRFRTRLARSLERPEVRFGLAAVVLLTLAISFHSPAQRLHAESRLESSPFEWTSDFEKRELEKQSYLLYLPKERSLHFFSLGNDALAASYVWIKAAGYVTREYRVATARSGQEQGPDGAARSGQPDGPDDAARSGQPDGPDGAARRAGAEKKFAWLSKLYDTAFELDPHWVGACRIGAMILAAVGGDPSAAIGLLERGISANPDSWILPYEAGLTMLMWPGHEEEAARYFRTAVQRPMDPDRREVVLQIIPRLEAEAGRLDLAVRNARARALRFAGQLMGEASSRQLKEFVARQLELDIQEAVASFRERHGRFPADIAELRRAGFLVRLDVHFAEAVVVFGTRLEELLELFRGMFRQAPAPESAAVLGRSGFLNSMVLAGRFDPPEWRDTFGKPFLYHAPSGSVRSKGLAEIEARRTVRILDSAAAALRRRQGRTPASLDELARHYAERIAKGRQLKVEWAKVFEHGRAPSHPLAPWGAGFEYDARTGRTSIRPVRPDEAGKPGLGE